jgi:hypothetical protein
VFFAAKPNFYRPALRIGQVVVAASAIILKSIVENASANLGNLSAGRADFGM